MNRDPHFLLGDGVNELQVAAFALARLHISGRRPFVALGQAPTKVCATSSFRVGTEVEFSVI